MVATKLNLCLGDYTQVCQGGEGEWMELTSLAAWTEGECPSSFLTANAMGWVSEVGSLAALFVWWRNRRSLSRPQHYRGPKSCAWECETHFVMPNCLSLPCVIIISPFATCSKRDMAVECGTVELLNAFPLQVRDKPIRGPIKRPQTNCRAKNTSNSQRNVFVRERAQKILKVHRKVLKHK